MSEGETTSTEKGGESNQSRAGFTKSCWLLSSLADMEERMKRLALEMQEEDEEGDTFAERAESYYQKRPQLLALLQDLYKAFLSLADRRSQTLAKNNHLHHHHRNSSQTSTVCFDFIDYDDHDGDGASETDAESSLSYQQQQQQQQQNPPSILKQTVLDDDATVIAELVIKNVEYDMLLNEVGIMERRFGESSRKIELQKSLLEVLESERLILLNENSRLGYKVAALVEENKGLAAESMLMKRKAGELARCVLNMREDHRVCMLSRKIEDLQGQIYGLEKRNKDYYQQLVEAKRSDQKLAESNGVEEKLKVSKSVTEKQQRLKNQLAGYKSGGGGAGGRGSSWWDRFKKFDLFVCGTHLTCSSDV